MFFLFWIRLAELVELGEFNYNQSSMTEGYCKLFCISHSQLALWCSGYDSWWESVGSEFKIQEFLIFWKEKPSLILNSKSEKHEWIIIPLENFFLLSKVHSEQIWIRPVPLKVFFSSCSTFTWEISTMSHEIFFPFFSDHNVCPQQKY